MKYYTLRQIKNQCIRELSHLYDSREAESITNRVLEHVLNENHQSLSLQQNLPIDRQTLQIIESYLKELKEGKPVQHLLGYAYFRDIKLYVNRDVLIPRSETEMLVENVLEDFGRDKDGPFHGLDIGTGSGCIPLSLMMESGNISMDAMDMSTEAIEVARKNSRLYDIKTNFFVDNIFDFQDGKYRSAGYDFIVSNPPYVLDSDKEFMHRNVLEHEPQKALFVPEQDSIMYYKTILDFTSKFLKKEGKIYFEIHEKKGEEIKSLLLKRNFTRIKLKKDLAGKFRIIEATSTSGK